MYMHAMIALPGPELTLISSLHNDAPPISFQDIITRIRVNNKPEIPASKVLGFATRAAAEAYMADHLDSILGAVHFVQRAGGQLDYILQSSSTVSAVCVVTRSSQSSCGSKGVGH